VKFVPIEDRCQGRVRSSGFRGSSPCSNRATILTPDGRRFCSIHDPVKVAERRKKSNERVNRKIQEMDERIAKAIERERRAALYDEMVAALRRARSCIDGMSLPHGYGPQQFILPEIDAVLKKAGAL
jgi:hypothetical protein